MLARGVRDDAPGGAPTHAPNTVRSTAGFRSLGASHGLPGPPTLVVASCEVLLAWRETSPGVPFVPRPAPKPVAASSGPAAAPFEAAGPAPACKFWVNTGRCARGDACAQRHDDGGRDEWVASRRAGRASLAAASGDPHAGSAPAKARRAAAFADFLVATHGVEALRSGCGVLDVAGGGAGGVAFELHCRWGVPTTVVDPRPPVLCRRSAATLAAAPQHALADTRPAHCAELFDVRLAKERFPTASAIVGMHPDQATDAVVDAALALGCPFAVVPCCVFPALFAQTRRTPDGRRVTSRHVA